ncbi:hypothetical protein DPMN_153303 [Dreissena polymorpha]|uniref:MAM domain-containing protein n=2 Tax=Dreissena polymorpha TaxID=45954 RepID=A0A9D4FMY3_DREPO|nr:hypothetical protein DPMN_153303 [Dreissena polymorpha]
MTVQVCAIEICASQRSCLSCTSKNTFIPFQDVACQWCPLDRKCHTFGYDGNPCLADMDIKESSLCENSSNNSPDFDESKALMFIKLSAVAYAEPEYLKKCIKHILPNGDFEIVEAIGRKCERWFDYKECFAYTAISHGKKTILVGYRGTADFIQLADEGLVEQIMCHLSTGTASAYRQYRGQVNTYFSFAFERLYDPCIRESVKKLADKYHDYDVVITGHSLGGALASLTAYKLVTEGVVAKDRMLLYTFGMPRVGDKRYAFDHDKAVPNSWRIIHWHDIVPSMPQKSCGYYHHKTAVLYPENMTPVGSGYTICSDNEDLTCNELKGWSISQHLSYFGIDVGGYCQTNLKYKRETNEPKFPEDYCEVISLKDAGNIEIITVGSSVCDFERNFCGWTRANGSTLNFKRMKGPVDRSGVIGPAYDRNKSVLGYYILADASYNEGQITKLRSPNFLSGSYCFEFYYYVDDDSGIFKLKMYTTETKSKTIVSKFVSRGRDWRHFHANVRADALEKGEFYFEFEAQIGSSNIALDDISIRKGLCQS